MRKKMIALLFCVALSSALAAGCGSSKEEAKAPVEDAEEEEPEAEPEKEEPEDTAKAEEPEAGEDEDKPAYEEGRWEETVYTNETLGITMTVPDSFLIVTGDDLRELLGTTQDVVLEDSALSNVDTSEVIYDFMAMSSDMVGNIILSIENNKLHMSAEQYGNALKTSMKVLGAECEMLEEPAVRMVGDTDFYEMKMQLDYSGMTGIDDYAARQYYLIHADDNYLYYFTVTFNPDNIQEIEDVLNTLQPI